MKSQKQIGMSLIEVIVATGLMSILSIFIMTMFDNARKESILLDQKLALAELRKNLISYGSIQDICKKTFSEITSTFPTDSIPSEIDLPRLYASPTSTLKLVENNSPLIPSYTSFKVSSIKLKQLLPVNSTSYSAKLVIETTGSRIPFRPIEVNVFLKSQVTASDTQFQGCASSETTLALATVGCPAGKLLNGFDASGAPICLSGFAGVSCSTGYYLQGFTSAGTPDCKALPSSSTPPASPPASPPVYAWSYSTIYGSTTDPVQTAGACNSGNFGQVITTGNINSYVCGASGGCCLACGGFYCVNQGETIWGCHTTARCQY